MERLRLLVEGVNNKIRVLQRRAYGYRDEEYLKLKNRGGIPSAITQKCRLQPTRIRVDPQKSSAREIKDLREDVIKRKKRVYR